MTDPDPTPGSRVRSTIPGFPWIGTVTKVEDSLCPFKIAWDNGTVESVLPKEIEVLSAPRDLDALLGQGRN